MKNTITNITIFAVAFLLMPGPIAAQPPWPYMPPPMMGAPTTPSAQRTALNGVRSQLQWLQNTARTASSYANGVDLVWGQFQTLRQSYTGLKMTLNERQFSQGANEIAELDAGLDILQEVFSNYQNDVAGGRSPAGALKDVCQVLSRGATVWGQQLNRVSQRLRVGL